MRIDRRTYLDGAVAVFVDLSVVDDEPRPGQSPVRLSGFVQAIHRRPEPAGQLRGVHVPSLGEYQLLGHLSLVDVKHRVTPYFT